MRGENAWSRYGLASLLCLEGREYERAVSGMEMGLMERAGDLSYVKEGFRVLARCSGYDALIRVYEQLPENVVARPVSYTHLLIAPPVTPAMILSDRNK